MTADLQDQAHVNEAVLYMALELSNAKWGLAFGDGTRQRQVVIMAGDACGQRGEHTDRLNEKVQIQRPGVDMWGLIEGCGERGGSELTVRCTLSPREPHQWMARAQHRC